MALDQVQDTEEKEMGFLDHLEELRWHLVRSVAAIVVFSIAAFLAKGFVWDVLIFGPTRDDFWTYRVLCDLAERLSSPLLCLGEIPINIQNRQITGQFTMHIKSSLVIGLVIGFPYTFWEIWRFVKPGLHKNERRASRGIVFVVSFLFLLGVLFGYYIVTPLSMNFLGNYQLSEFIKNDIDINSLLGLVATLALACGLMFQLPVVSYMLSKAGILTPELMRRYRKHAIVVILIISAIITPPDWISQVLIALPISMLYEIGILISKIVNKRAEKEAK